MSNQSHTLQQKASMRHLYLFAHMLLAETKRIGRSVEIAWGGTSTAQIGPSVENDRLLIMRLPQMQSLGCERDACLLKALVSHEILVHGHHTDFSVDPAPSLLESNLRNVIEDVRGELLAAVSYPGSRQDIHDGLRILVDLGLFGPPSKEMPAPALLVGWLVTQLRATMLKQSCLAPFAPFYREEMIHLIGPDVVKQIEVIAESGCFSPSTQAVALRAKEIADLLRGAGDGKQESPDGDAGGGNETPATDGPKDPSGAQGEKFGSGEGAGKPDDNSSTQSSGDGVSQFDSKESDDFGPYAGGLEDALSQANGAFEPDAQNPVDDPTGAFTHEMREVLIPDEVTSPSYRSSLRQKARVLASALMLKLSSHLETLTQVRCTYGHEGRLRGKHLARVLQGDTKVFYRKGEVRDLDTCVYALVDESRSMSDSFGFTSSVSKRETAGSVVVAMGEALLASEIPFGFSTYNTDVREWQSVGGNWGKTLMRYVPASFGCTNTHLAVSWAGRRMIGRSEKRKVVVVVTDGDPGDAKTLEAGVKEISRLGIEVVFVLLGNRYVKKFSAADVNFTVAFQASDLAPSVFQVLEQSFL